MTAPALGKTASVYQGAALAKDCYRLGSARP